MLSGTRQSIVTYQLPAGSIIMLLGNFAKDPQVKYIATKLRSVGWFLSWPAKQEAIVTQDNEGLPAL